MKRPQRGGVEPGGHSTCSQPRSTHGPAAVHADFSLPRRKCLLVQLVQVVQLLYSFYRWIYVLVDGCATLSDLREAMCCVQGNGQRSKLRPQIIGPPGPAQKCSRNPAFAWTRFGPLGPHAGRERAAS